jgi:hypothetical protein
VGAFVPLLVLIVFWVVLSLVTAPIIGALFVPRHRSEDRPHGIDPPGRLRELSARTKEPARPGGEEEKR